MSHANTTQVSVSVIGLGLMGRALADAVIGAGNPTTVWNRTAEKVTPLVESGALHAGSVADAFTAGSLVLVCVTDHDAVMELLTPHADQLTGRTVVNLSSGSAAQAREAARWAADHGIAYLDGAILSDPAGIGSETTALLYSGSEDAYQRAEPVLRGLGGASRYLGGDPALASLFDVAVLGLMWGILNGYLHATAMLAAADVDATAFTPIASQAIGTVTGWLPAYAGQIDEGTYPGTDSTLDTHVAAMAHLVAESEELGVDTQLPRLVEAIATRAVEAGRGAEGYATLFEDFRSPVSSRGDSPDPLLGTSHQLSRSGVLSGQDGGA